MGLLTIFNPAEWKIDGDEDIATALPLAIATFCVAAGAALAEGKEREALAPVNGKSFLARLLGQDPADDEVIWRHIVKRIYWTWKFGLTSTVFDHADSIILGLPRDREVGGVCPGQIERMAQAGEGIYWKRLEDGSYRLKRDLLTSYTDTGSPKLNP
jgi:hypothetical protein